MLEAHNFIDVYRITDYKNPFDGYRCQPVIAFDEFRSSLRLKEMLLYCDIYPLELPSRYANKYACYNKVYIISNWALERQYPEAQREDRESWEAFLRRIHKVITYDDKGKKIIYPSVQAYFERDTAVSYTHLDVYKRQVLRLPPVAKAQGCGLHNICQSHIFQPLLLKDFW